MFRSILKLYDKGTQTQEKTKQKIPDGLFFIRPNMTVLSLLTNLSEQQQQQQQQPQEQLQQKNDVEKNTTKQTVMLQMEWSIDHWAPLNISTYEISSPLRSIAPTQPKELQEIPYEMWVEFFKKVKDAATAADDIKNDNNNNNNRTTSSAIIDDDESSSFFVVHAALISNILLGLYLIQLVVCLVLISMGYFVYALMLHILSYLYIIGICLQRNDYDKQHGAKIQAVCSRYSPTFEKYSNYFVEYKDYKSGLQFRQKKND